MKADEVPQDNSATFAGHTKALYARNESGRYATVESSGWVVEEAATRLAINVFDEALLDAQERCEGGHTAALEYHMYARRMDIETLSDATGIWRWRVRRHLRPSVFAGLSPRLMARYAAALQMSESDLRQLPASTDQAP